MLLFSIFKVMELPKRFHLKARSFHPIIQTINHLINKTLPTSRKQRQINTMSRQTLGRRRHLMSSFAKSETANLVPLRLERSESASDKT